MAARSRLSSLSHFELGLGVGVMVVLRYSWPWIWMQRASIGIHAAAEATVDYVLSKELTEALIRQSRKERYGLS